MPQNARRYVYVSGKEPVNTHVWECDFETIEEVVKNLTAIFANPEHDRLLKLQTPYMLSSYTEILLQPRQGESFRETSETYPICYADTQTANYFHENDRNAEYREELFVGYRYFDTAYVKVSFPFRYFDAEANCWKREQLTYDILIGASSQDIRLSAPYELKREDITNKQNVPDKYDSADIKNVSEQEFEKLLGFKSQWRLRK